MNNQPNNQKGTRKYEELYDKSYELRKRFLEIFTRLGFGHVTTAFSSTEIIVALYYKIMNYNDNPDWEYRDRFVLSKGHGAGMLFPVFEDVGFFSKQEMQETIRIGGNYKKLKKYFYPGFEFYGGSLGMGLGMAAGMAYHNKVSDEQLWNTYVLLGDAECYEGSVFEAAEFAGANHLSNLIAVVDRNFYGVSDFTEHMLAIEPFADKWKANNWEVITVDGHCYEELIPALKNASERKTDKPVCIIANTVKGKGLEYLYNNPLMHGYVPKNEDDIERAFQELKHY